MPSPEKKTYLVAYDVVSDRRRNRLARRLAEVGVRVNYSVFEVVCNDGEFGVLTADLRRFVKASQDHVRIYPLCRRCLDGGQVIGTPHPERLDSGVEEV